MKLVFILGDAAVGKMTVGQELMEHWERDMHTRGYDLVMTSTQADQVPWPLLNNSPKLIRFGGVCLLQPKRDPFQPARMFSHRKPTQ